MATITFDTLKSIAIRELATKADPAALKSDLVKWIAGMLIAQAAAVVATLVKLL